MTEYRLVPVEPTPEMLDAVKPWPPHWPPMKLATVELLAAYHADRLETASTYRAMLAAAPPAPTREEVARIIDPVVGCDRSDVPGLRHEEALDDREADAYAKADAILSLLGRQSAAVMRAKEGEG